MLVSKILTSFPILPTTSTSRYLMFRIPCKCGDTAARMDELLPTRSRTDPTALESQRSQLGHIGRRLHANTIGQLATSNNPRQPHHHHSSHHHRNAAKDTVQSAVELKPPIAFDNLLRRDKKGIEIHPKEGPELDSSPASHHQHQIHQIHPRSHHKPTTSDVARAQHNNAKREAELRTSFKAVEDIGMSSTRQLDDTYYAILEKASLLRSTISNLQQLADESKKIHSGFRDSTQKLESETKETLNSFTNFSQQETNINALVSALQASRSKTEKLNSRLEAARHRVEAYEFRDNAAQAKRRAQMHTAWLCLFGVAVVIVAMLVAKNRERVGDAVEAQLMRIGDLVEDVAAPGRRAKAASEESGEDPFLSRLFDGL